MIVGSATAVVFVQDVPNRFCALDIGVVNLITSLLKVKNVAIVVRKWDVVAISSVMEVCAVLLIG